MTVYEVRGVPDSLHNDAWWLGAKHLPVSTAPTTSDKQAKERSDDTNDFDC